MKITTQKFFQVFFAILFVVVGMYFYTQKKSISNTADDTSSISDLKNNLNTNTGHEDLLAFSIVPGTSVHGILSYRGTLKGGYFFEGNIRIFVLDENKNILKESNAISKTDWMTDGPVDFEGNIDFTGLAKSNGYFRIANDNPSGDIENEKVIDIPIVIE